MIDVEENQYKKETSQREADRCKALCGIFGTYLGVPCEFGRK